MRINFRNVTAHRVFIEENNATKPALDGHVTLGALPRVHQYQITRDFVDEYLSNVPSYAATISIVFFKNGRKLNTCVTKFTSRSTSKSHNFRNMIDAPNINNLVYGRITVNAPLWKPCSRDSAPKAEHQPNI